MGREDAVAHGHRVVTVHFHVASSNRPKFMYLFSVLYVLGVMRVHNLCNGAVGRQGIPNIAVVPVIICCLIKKPRLHFFALLSKAAKKLRLSQDQPKKLVKKLIFPYESSFLPPWS